MERFSHETIAALCAYDWPGNVRELRNAVESSLLSARRMVIDLHGLPDKVGESDGEARRHDSELSSVMENGIDRWLANTERRLIMAALKETGGVQMQATRLLGISVRSLWRRVKKMDIRVNREVSD